MKIAVCTTIDSNYADYAIVCLQSFRYNSGLDIKPFVFVNKKTLSTKQISNFNKNDITIININLLDRYIVSNDSPYPSECFWIFKCPEILYDMGYDYVLSVDTDTYCNTILNLDFLDQIQFVAGIDRGTTNQEFLNDIGQLEKLSRIFALRKDRLSLKASNTGVLIFNNKYCRNINFEEKIYQLFKTSIKHNIPRKGDDSLFCLYCSVYHAPICYISNKFNDYKFFKQPFVPSEEPYIIHYGFSMKPWNKKTQNLNKISKYYIDKWLVFQKQLNLDANQS